MDAFDQDLRPEEELDELNDHTGDVSETTESVVDSELEETLPGDLDFQVAVEAEQLPENERKQCMMV